MSTAASVIIMIRDRQAGTLTLTEIATHGSIRQTFAEDTITPAWRGGPEHDRHGMLEKEDPVVTGLLSVKRHLEFWASAPTTLISPNAESMMIWRRHCSLLGYDQFRRFSRLDLIPFWFPPFLLSSL